MLGTVGITPVILVTVRGQERPPMTMDYKEEDGHNHSGVGPGTAVKSKKPDNTAFKQQRLPAWQPILTAGTVLPAFFVIGIIFIPIGIGIFVTSNNIREYEVSGGSRRAPGGGCVPDMADQGWGRQW